MFIKRCIGSLGKGRTNGSWDIFSTSVRRNEGLRLKEERRKKEEVRESCRNKMALDNLC